MKSIKHTQRIDPNTHEKLKIEAEKNNTNRSAVVRSAIEKYLENK